MKEVFLIGLVSIFGLYGLICIVLYWRQESLIFFPDTDTPDAPAELGIEEVFFPGEAGRLHAWYLDQGSPRAILYLHGNTGNVSYRIEEVEVFKEAGITTLMLDYRGYGRSEGRIRQESDLYTDVQSAYSYLIEERGFSEEDIIIWGTSLGGALAVEMASRVQPRHLILESTFLSLGKIADLQYPPLPRKFLLRYLFESEKKIGSITSRILIMHSTEDELIPYSHGEALRDLAVSAESVSFCQMSGGHSTGFLRDKKEYSRRIREFLSER